MLGRENNNIKNAWRSGVAAKRWSKGRVGVWARLIGKENEMGALRCAKSIGMCDWELLYCIGWMGRESH